MKVYECPSCNHKFTNSDENCKYIVYSERCPSPKCGKSLPDGLIGEFRCQNCNNVKSINEIGHVIFVAKIITALGSRMMRKVCKKCSPQVNIFGLVMTGLFILTFIAYLDHFK